MGRPRQATPEQEAEILRLHAADGLGSIRIAKKLGLRRGMVWRVLHRVRPVLSLPGSPQKALPVEKAHEIRKIPPAAEIGAPIGKCPLCKQPKVPLIAGLGMCAECLRSELTWGSRPLGVGLCWGCGANPAPIHEWEDARTREAGLCAPCRRRLISVARRDPPPPVRDDRGLWWNPEKGYWDAS